MAESLIREDYKEFGKLNANMKFVMEAVKEIQKSLTNIERRQEQAEIKLAAIESQIDSIEGNVNDLQQKQETDIKEIHKIQKQKSFFNFVRQNYRIFMVLGMMVGGMVGGITMVYEYLKAAKGL